MLHARGHTVVEMLLVVGILAIVTSAAGARFRSLTFKKDTQRLTALMNDAQRRSIESGHRYILRISSAQRHFCLNKNEEGSKDVRATSIHDQCFRSLQLNDAVQVEAEIEQIIFYPDSHMTANVVRLHDREHMVIFSTRKQWGKVRMTECAGNCRER